MQNNDTPAEGTSSDQTVSESALRGATCSPSSLTPESDAACRQIDCASYDEWESRIVETMKRLESERDAARSMMVRLYNQGYHAGHEDTVEACFTPIHHTDMDTYHADVVTEIILENSSAQPPDKVG